MRLVDQWIGSKIIIGVDEVVLDEKVVQDKGLVPDLEDGKTVVEASVVFVGVFLYIYVCILINMRRK
jgi:hypothetical protein